ncbi:PNGase [Symbiodinium pilosum]|uniref:PNGase protein n=1 Tax=Symbiodinium pilosum TaxID=2952 RepID=A0A812NEH4_SYMPI|nr:PNGase [Symbiodinium pilosum]
MEAPLENRLGRALRLEEQPPLAAKQLQANYGIGYAMLVNMGYSGGGPTPLCGVRRISRAGLQEDEELVVDATMKRGVKRRKEQWAKLDGQQQDDEEELQEEDSYDEELCGLGKALVRELRSTRDKKMSIPQLAKKPRVLRVLDLWQIEADFERFLKQFVRDELQSICELVRSSGIAIKKITNKTSRFARACEEAWMVHLKVRKAKPAAELTTQPPCSDTSGTSPSQGADSLYPDDWGVDIGAGHGACVTADLCATFQRCFFRNFSGWCWRLAPAKPGFLIMGHGPVLNGGVLRQRCIEQQAAMSFQQSSIHPAHEAKPAASTDFRDADGYDFVGDCCSLARIPVGSGTSCLSPALTAAANSVKTMPPRLSMTVSAHQSVVAAVCPQCGATVKWEDAVSSEQEAMAKHREVCKPVLQADKEICPAEGCKTKLNTMNSVVCSECKTKVCLKHRFEDQHPCRESKGQWLSRLSASERPQMSLRQNGVQNWGSGASGRAAPLQPSPHTGTLNGEMRVDGSISAQASSSRLVELRNALGSSEEARLCLTTLRKLLSNVAADPRNPKFRSVKRDNKAIQQKILDVPGGEELMIAVGFESSGETLMLPETVSTKRIEAILQLILS